jgi:hypothetical protein
MRIRRHLDCAVAAAALAGIPKDRIINTMTRDELHEWTAPRRAR